MTAKKGFSLSKLLFEEAVPTEETLPQTQSATAQTSNAMAASVATPTYVAPVSIQSQNDTKVQELIKTLFEAVNSHPKPGVIYDYTKFKQTTKSLEGVISDERVRFISAFTSAKVMQATKAQLIDSTNHALSVIDSESSQFNEMVKGQRATIDNYTKQMASVQEQIAQKQAEIDQLSKSVGEIALQRDTAEQKLNLVTSSFQSAAQAVMNEIKGDLTKITNYITE